MKTIQFRQAIAEAMTEEMRRDETIYLNGRRSCRIQWSIQGIKGNVDEFGAKRVIDTPYLS